MNAYKGLATCFSQIQMHKQAQTYHYKMLCIAWLLRDKNRELQAYDLIGLDYYYLNEIDRAIYFHSKQARGQVELDSSISKQCTIKQLHTISATNQHKLAYGGALKLHNINYCDKELLNCPISDEEIETMITDQLSNVKVE